MLKYKIAFNISLSNVGGYFYFYGVFMKKKTFYTELAYIVGIITLAIGTAFMEKANFGMSMVVSPAYIIHLKVSEFLPFFSFGMAGYTLQAVLLVLMMIFLRRFKLSYLFSFATAVIYGFTLDGAIALASFIPAESILLRIVYFVVGMLICSIGVSMFFHTYISPEAYELFVKELSEKFGISITKFKTGYDCASCLISIIMSFAFFGLWHFEGVKLGTVVCALVNGYTIGLWSKFFEKHFEFKDGLKLKKFFK